MKRTVALVCFFLPLSVFVAFAANSSALSAASFAAEKPELSILETIHMDTSSATPIVFNAGASRPGTLEYSIEGIDRTFKAGELVTLENGVSLEVIPKPPLQISGPGLGGGTFCAAVAPYNHNLMFFATDMGGTFRSSDGGKNWRVLPNLEGMHVGPGPQFLLDQKTIVWAGKAVTGDTDKVCVSTDTGVTWKSVRLPVNQVRLRSGTIRYNSPICAVPFRDGLLIGTKLDGLLFFNPANMSFTTLDNKMESDPDGFPRGVWSVEVDGNNIYYVTGKELREKRYLPESDSYSQTTVKYTASNYILGFGFGAETYLMSILNDGVYKSSNGKDFSKIYDFEHQTWFKITPSGTMYMAPAWHTAFYARDIITWSTGTVGNKPLLKSVDGGKTWSNVFNAKPGGNVELTWIQKNMQWGYYFMWNGFCVLPGETTDTDILFNTTVGEMFRSNNGGRSWTAPYREYIGQHMGRDRNRSTGAEVTSVWNCVEDPHDPNILYGCWSDVQGQISPDKGESWVWAGKSGSVHGSTQNTLYGVTFHPDKPGWVAGAWAQTHDIGSGYVASVVGKGSVSISTDYGYTWNRPYRPMSKSNPRLDVPPNVNCTDVVYDHVNGILYAVFYSQRNERSDPKSRNGGIWKSMDLGLTWQRIHNGYPENVSPSNLHYIQIKLDNQQNVYALMAIYSRSKSVGGSIPGGLWKSTDHGETWKLLGPTGPGGTVWNRWPLRFCFGATADEIYVACADDLPGRTVGLAATFDGGITWRSLWGKGTPESKWEHITTVYVEGDFILIGGSRFRPRFSYDKGQTWQFWNDFPFNHIKEVVKLSDGRYAFCTFGQGIFFGQLPRNNGGTLGYSEGVLHVQNPNKTDRKLNITFTLTDKAGLKKTAKTSVVMGTDIGR